MKSSEELGARSSTDDVSCLVYAIVRCLSEGKLFRRCTCDLTDFDKLSRFISSLIGWLQRVCLSGGFKHALGNIIIVEGIELGLPEIRALGFGTIDVGHTEDVPGVIMLLDLSLGPVNIFIGNLISDEFEGLGRFVLNLAQLILWVQWVRGWASGDKALALGLGSLNIIIVKVVLRLIQLEMQCAGA